MDGRGYHPGMRGKAPGSDGPTNRPPASRPLRRVLVIVGIVVIAAILVVVAIYAAAFIMLAPMMQ